MRTKDPSYRAILELGTYLRNTVGSDQDTSRAALSPDGKLGPLLARVYQQNRWFTPESCLFALRYWGEMLRERILDSWLAQYADTGQHPKKVALILAGNIPLVGLHDVLCVLLTGNQALIKCASNDRLLLPFLTERLVGYEPGLNERIHYTDGTLTDHDAVIATGSNNTSRYFEYYFSSKPHIIRKNRHGIAVLNGAESPTELQGLATDIFRYFGLGCRSVSKLFVPKSFDFDPVFEAFYAYKEVVNHQKYANNYDYNKAVYLMSGSQMLDNGFLLLKEDSGYGSPIGTLFYETYDSREALQLKLAEAEDQLQCVVGGSWLDGSIPFGKAQWPELSNYADGVDTVEFLLKISKD